MLDLLVSTIASAYAHSLFSWFNVGFICGARGLNVV